MGLLSVPEFKEQKKKLGEEGRDWQGDTSVE